MLYQNIMMFIVFIMDAKKYDFIKSTVRYLTDSIVSSNCPFYL